VWLAHSSFKPLLCAGSAVCTAGPTAGAAFACLEVFDRALDSVAARRLLFRRDDPTNPFVPRQRCQILPGRLCRRFRAEGLAQIRRGFVHRTGSAFVLRHCFLPQALQMTLSTNSHLKGAPSAYAWGRRATGQKTGGHSFYTVCRDCARDSAAMGLRSAGVRRSSGLCALSRPCGRECR